MSKKKLSEVEKNQQIYNIKIQRKINRELELERNGGHWVAVKKVHKSKKDYNRKRDRKITFDDSCLFLFSFA